MAEITESKEFAAAILVNLRVLVLGGAGFIGRNVAIALHTAGATVVIGTRNPSTTEKRLMARLGNCERRKIQFENCRSHATWLPLLDNVDVVVNCVGILRERGNETYHAVHCEAPATLAAACKQKSTRLIHISALGLNHPHRSRFLTSKLAGEKALKISGADYFIVRPSLLEGNGGFGAHWIRRLASLPIHLVPTEARGDIAALSVSDLGRAIANLVTNTIDKNAPVLDREFDLGGSEIRNMAQYMASIRSYYGAPALVLSIPSWLARIGSHICDVLHFSPFSFGHWELLNCNNVPEQNRLPELLGRAPTPVWPAVTIYQL